MDRLPQELVTHVASFVEHQKPAVDFWERQKAVSKLPPYATLSRKWQLAIESRTFRSLQCKSSELPTLIHFLTRQPHRKRLLLFLTYDVVLPTYTDNECAKFETAEDMQKNNQAFTYAIHVLFQFLKTWDRENDSSLFLDLLDIHSPMDGRHRGPDKYEEDEEQYGLGKRHDLWEHRYEKSLLQLLDHPKLPTLSCVSRFQTYSHSRPIEPNSAILLTTKLPNVESVTLNLREQRRKDPHVRQQARYGNVEIHPRLFLGFSAVRK